LGKESTKFQDALSIRLYDESGKEKESQKESKFKRFLKKYKEWIIT